jgi:ParB-like chromosome segregation protein Spo0J
MHTPIVGRTGEGKLLLLYGQCELTALRELGAKTMDAIVLDAGSSAGEQAKLSLRLISLQDKPGALCEGLLLKEAVSGGVSRSEIQSMLGKSASWVSNRLSLVTRLDENVYELVKNGLLEARSAEEISRLPPAVQFTFAQSALREGLAKSAIELLAAGYRDESCPESVKAQILADPRAALLRMSDKRRAVSTGKPDGHKPDALPSEIGQCVRAAIVHTDRLRHILSGISAYEVSGCMSALKTLEAIMLALLGTIQGFFYPGKTEEDQ